MPNSNESEAPVNEEKDVESTPEDSSVDDEKADEAPAEEQAQDSDTSSVDDEKDWRKQLSKKNSENQSLRSRLHEAELQLSRHKAALAAGLPPVLADRLQGATADELKADAEALKKLFGRRGPSGLPEGSLPAPVESEGEPDLDAIGKRMYRN